MKTTTQNKLGLRFVFLLSALSLAVAAFGLSRSFAEEGRAIPALALDQPAPEGGTSDFVVLAGGCFWGVQGVFQHVKGVTNAVSGYAGGEAKTARYNAVMTGKTGHAEAVQVTFDPQQISYGRILQIFYSVAHDPTQLNRQGPDAGTQYRSAIFPRNADQGRTAKTYIAQLDQARAFDAAIVTKIEPDREFYAAEVYHQDFMTRNPTHPYIVYNDIPKIRDLKRIFPDVYRAEPVLVAGTRPRN
jgi:peptide-methionine (S)-S-oxide reductase